jgi:hypothetical protein
MQSYFLSGSNLVTIRVEDTTANDLTLHLQNMETLLNTTQSLSAEYTSSESLLKFTPFISGAYLSAEYRAYITDDTGSIWHGTFQVFASSSLDKSDYVNQNTGNYKSNVTTNEYIILT